MRKIYILITFSFLTTLSLAKAQEVKSPYSDLEHEVGEVVVTATRTPLPLKSSPVITRVISGQQISREGIPSLEALLEKEIAGVEFHQAGYGTSVSFQGLDARYVLFLVDGERMSGETYGNIDYQRIPLSNIERVEIVRGASSVLYGSNAMGAIVNIITKMPKKKVEVNGSVRTGTRFQRNFNETLGASATQSQWDTYRKKLDQSNIKADLNVGFNLGKFRSLTTASFQTTDAYKMTGRKEETRHYDRMNIMTMGSGMPPSFVLDRVALDTTIRVEPDKRGLGVSGTKNWLLSQKFDYTINKKFRLELSGNYMKKDRYDFQSSMMDDNPMSGIMPSDDPWKYESYDSYDAKFLMEHSPNSRNKIYLTYIRDEHFRNQEILGEKSIKKQRHTYNIPRLLWTAEFGENHRMTTGVEMVNEQLRLDLSEKGYDNVKSMNTASVYVQDEMYASRRLSFVAGLRADWNNRSGWRATPQVSVKYVLNDFTFRGNYSNGYRSPSLKEMYIKHSIPMPGTPTLHGNQNLKVESNHYFSLSTAYDHDWINLSATVNKSFFRNKIDVVWETTKTDEGENGESGGKREMYYRNIDRSEYGSIELIGRFRLARNLRFTANYNYVWEDKNAPEETTQYIFPSAHTATFGLDYWFTIKKNVRVAMNANVRYVGSKKYEDFMSYINIPDAAKEYIMKVMQSGGGRPPAPTEEERQGMRDIKFFTGSYTSEHNGYAICNASIDLEFYKQFSLTFGVNNIFNYSPKVVNFNSALTPKVNGFMKVGFKF